MPRIWRIVAPTPTTKKLVLPLGPAPLRPKEIRQAVVDEAVLCVLSTYAQVIQTVRRVVAAHNFDTEPCCITRNVLVNPVRCGPLQASINRIDNACGYADDWNLEAIHPPSPPHLFFLVIFYKV
jgi:hypothetical protein